MTKNIERIINSQCSDRRGKVFNFKNYSIENFHILTMEPGSVRGNHTHDKDEILCVIDGKGICEIIIEDKNSGKVKKFNVKEHIEIFRIKKGIKHTLRNKGNKLFYLVCFLVIYILL